MSLSQGKSPSSQISLTLKIMRRYPKEENDIPLATEALDHELWSYTDHEKAGFLNPHTCDILRQTTLCCGGLSCALQDVETHPWPLSTRCQQHSLSGVNQKCLQTLSKVPSWELPLTQACFEAWLCSVWPWETDLTLLCPSKFLICKTELMLQNAVKIQ